jgi:hypothetical protein
LSAAIVNVLILVSSKTSLRPVNVRSLAVIILMQVAVTTP